MATKVERERLKLANYRRIPNYKLGCAYCAQHLWRISRCAKNDAPVAYYYKTCDHFEAQ